MDVHLKPVQGRLEERITLRVEPKIKAQLKACAKYVNVNADIRNFLEDYVAAVEEKVRAQESARLAFPDADSDG